MSIAVVIQARMGSARLPGKSLRVLSGRPLLAHVIERAQAIRGVDRVVVATSDAPADRALYTMARDLGADAIIANGLPEWDVLSRMILAADFVDADVIVRVTGDCPLLAPEVATRAVQLYRAHQQGMFPMAVPYVTNDTARSGYPDGTDVEVVESEALLLADAALDVKDRVDREHVTTWVRAHLAGATMKSDDDWSRLKLSVDTLEDLARVQAILAHVPGGDFSLPATILGAQAAGLL